VDKFGAGSELVEYAGFEASDLEESISYRHLLAELQHLDSLTITKCVRHVLLGFEPLRRN